MNKKLPRHGAGKFELVGGTGPITTMCSCGDFVEIYKEDKTFQVQTPESIDPEEINPNAPWVVSPTSDVGSANTLVARVLIQGAEILKSAAFDGQVDKVAVVRSLYTCKEALVAAEIVEDRISSATDRIIDQINCSGISTDNNGRGLNPFPQIQNLDSECGTFLIQVNRAIKLICEMPQHFFALQRVDSNFDHLQKRLKEVMGEDAILTKFITANADGIRYLVDLRNYHEHPKAVKTLVDNFRVLPDGSIRPPVWHLSGSTVTDPHSIKDEMKWAIRFLRDTAEAMLIHLVMVRISKQFPFIIEEVQDDKMDPKIPIKFRLMIDPRILGHPRQDW